MPCYVLVLALIMLLLKSFLA